MAGIISVIGYFDFIKRHLGRAMDYDGAYGAQCVDLIKYYLKECFGISPGSWGNARDYFERFTDKTWAGYKEMQANFIRMENTVDFVPMTGDIGIFVPTDRTDTKSPGHIVVCSGEGNTSKFYSYDQNWTGNRDACARIQHKYVKEGSKGQLRFIGVLRPKNRDIFQRTVTADVNVRKGAGTLYSVIGEKKKGEIITVNRISGKWIYAENVGWVNQNFVA